MRRVIINCTVIFAVMAAMAVLAGRVSAGIMHDLNGLPIFNQIEVCTNGARFELISNTRKHTPPPAGKPYTLTVQVTDQQSKQIVGGPIVVELPVVEPFLIPQFDTFFPDPPPENFGYVANLNRFSSIKWRHRLEPNTIVNFAVGGYVRDGDGSAFEPSAVVANCTLRQGYLDNFNRQNGGVGSSWGGNTNGYRIQGRQLTVGTGGALYWQGRTSQEASVQLVNIDPNGSEQGLLLQVQGNQPDWQRGAIKVIYDARAKQVRVASYQRGSWQVHFTKNVTFRNGDTLGAAVFEDLDSATPASIMVSRKPNSSNVTQLLGVVDTNRQDLKFFRSKGGRVGLWFLNASKARVDDFTGTINPTE